jgi:hypothetical protein
VTLLSRILTFDQALGERVGEEIVVGLAHQSRFRASLLERDRLLSECEDQQPSAWGIPIRFTSLEVEDPEVLGEELLAQGVDILLLTPLRAVDVGQIAKAATRAGILTFSAVPEYTVEGVAVVLGVRGGRPEIIIRRRTAEAAGARFTSELLNLARLVPEGGPR